MLPIDSHSPVTGPIRNAGAVRAVAELQALHDGFGPLLRLVLRDERRDGGVESFAVGRWRGMPNCVLQDGYPVSLKSLLRQPTVLANSSSNETELGAEFNGPKKINELQQYRSWLAETEREEEAVAALLREECKERSAVEVALGEHVLQAEAALREIQRRLLPPALMQKVHQLGQEEEFERAGVHQQYVSFCAWVTEMTPQWLRSVRQQEQQSAAKHQAMEAAKKALELELLHQAGVSSSSFTAAPILGGLPPSANGDVGRTFSSVPERASATAPDEDPYAALRRQAIVMLAQQEEAVKGRRNRELHVLAEEEHRLREQLAQREEGRRREERAQRCASAVEEEAAIRARIAERERLAQIRREERAILIEHLKAEEGILRKRLQRYEEQRQEEAKATRLREAAEKQKAADRLRIEEEILQQRLKEHEHMKYVQAVAAAQAKEFQEAAARRQWERQQADTAEALALERSREALRQQELEHERRRLQRMEPPPTSSVYASPGLVPYMTGVGLRTPGHSSPPPLPPSASRLPFSYYPPGGVPPSVLYPPRG